MQPAQAPLPDPTPTNTPTRLPRRFIAYFACLVLIGYCALVVAMGAWDAMERERDRARVLQVNPFLKGRKIVGK